MGLLEVPSGTRADWTILKGKAVVLEFWATWCLQCVANMPHLNQLAPTTIVHLAWSQLARNGLGMK